MKPSAARESKDRPKPISNTAAVKDAKSDSSFFSAPKPKPKLPSFKKAPAPAPIKKEENVAQPSSVDPFQEVLRTMKARKESPAVSTPPAAVNTPPQTNSLSKNGKKKKYVTWAPDSQLESVKLIERAVYDDEPSEVSHRPIHSGHVPWNVLMPLSRECTLPIACVTWIVAKVQPSMHTSSRRRWIGQSLQVSSFCVVESAVNGKDQF